MQEHVKGKSSLRNVEILYRAGDHEAHTLAVYIQAGLEQPGYIPDDPIEDPNQRPTSGLSIEANTSDEFAASKAALHSVGCGSVIFLEASAA